MPREIVDGRHPIAQGHAAKYWNRITSEASARRSMGSLQLPPEALLEAIQAREMAHEGWLDFYYQTPEAQETIREEAKARVGWARKMFEATLDFAKHPRLRPIAMPALGVFLAACQANPGPSGSPMSPAPSATAAQETAVPPTQTAAPEATQSPNPDSSGWVELAHQYESAREAAERHGADEWSRNPDHWFVNEYGGAGLMPRPDGLSIRVRAGGAVVDGWEDINRPGRPQRDNGVTRNADAIGIVVHPNYELEFDIRAGTWWDFGLENATAGWEQVLLQQREREAIEQPGVVTIPVNECPPMQAEGFINLAHEYESAREAAERHGGNDPWASDERNWFINEYGGATLRPRPDGVIARVTLAGAVLDGWLRIERPGHQRVENGVTINADAIGVVAHPNVMEIDIQGATFWDFGDNADAGWRQVFIQQREREAIEQPGVVTLPGNECPTDPS